MKRIFLVLVSVAMISFVACNNKGKEENKTEDTVTIETTTETEVPSFDNEKLGEYITAYDSYLEDYKKVVESKDMTKFQELATKGQELAEKAQALTAEGLSEADGKKLNDYLQEKSKEIQELSQKMMQ